ncbi:putative BOI-related E3 ubiquitin-protein ligase 3 [Apium graveolens]|uniref:putative BOI-related E3 ubiquitin-protein ligase 3 n=1 Tax=Apium graveolens TaxID=4045 RepID=UPI003D798978
MAFQTWKQHQFTHITTTNRQSVNEQAGAARFNSPVQMGSSNPFATTMENPWLGLNHMLLGSSNMVIQTPTNPNTSTHSGPTYNTLPDDNRKRSRVSTENQVHNFNFNAPPPSSSLVKIRNDMIWLQETDRKLRQQAKRVRMQLAEKQSEAAGHLVDVVANPILKKLKEKDEEIVNMGKSNMDLKEKVNNVLHLNQAWKEYATSCEIKAMSKQNDLEEALAEVTRLQELLRSYGAVEAPPEEKNLNSHCGSNISGNNTQRIVQGYVRVKIEDDGETKGKKVQTETGEGSGVKKVCESCGHMEKTLMGLPWEHLCICLVCGTGESRPCGPCPVCAYKKTTAANTLSLA